MELIANAISELADAVFFGSLVIFAGLTLTGWRKR